MKTSVRKRKEGTILTANPNKVELRYGPLPRFPHQRVWSRGIIILGVLVYIWYFSKGGKETMLAARKDVIPIRGQTFDCHESYMADISQYANCAPKRCGRYVTDKIVSSSEAAVLLKMANQGLTLGGSSGGASILDIHSGALSYGEKFINVKSLPESKSIFTTEYVTVYKIVKEKIQHAVAEQFNVDVNSLHLTHPTFFSRMTNAEPKTKHDEYWHVHIDKETYKSFHYTTLLYLSDYGVDFSGGRFVFQDTENGNFHNITVEPRVGRVSMFSSGAENVHYVEKVTSGTRYAITISFTCDTKHSIELPSIEN